MKYDFLIVGAGFAGSVLAERIANELNKKCLVVDKRNHIGGNCFDFPDENGIIVHKYGPHIFHTNIKKVWDYLSRFTDWEVYFHNVLAVVEGKKIPVPFNLNSLEMIFPKTYCEKLERILLEQYGYGIKIPILKLMDNNNSELKALADYIYKNVFLGYTVKQWGVKPEELDFSVSSRVPVFISRDNRYFQDTYQAIPAKGYTELFNKLLNHKNIELMLNTDYKTILNDIQFDRIIYTGPIDYFFDYIHGELPYRSLEFQFRTYDMKYFQETAQINYPNNYDFTRITEFKHFLHNKAEKTVIAYEFPKEYIKSTNEPYYPIPHEKNDSIYAKYTDEARKLGNASHFVGRLAEYKYYNMDQIVSIALQYFEKHIATI